MINFSYALPALIQTFSEFGKNIAKLPDVTVRKKIYYVDLSPNTGFLAVDIKKEQAYRVAKIGEPKAKSTYCSPELLALVLRHINDQLDK